MMAHSIRGKVDTNNEEPRYCVACHITEDAIVAYGAEYSAFRTSMANNNFGTLNFPLLQQHFGLNTGNDMNSPLWVHMVAGLGTGLFLFDEEGCPVNDLDIDTQRKGCNGVAPKTSWDPNRVRFNLDRLSDGIGGSSASSNHPMINPGQGPNLRLNATDPNLAGPLGTDIIQRLAHPDPSIGIHLDSWLDADGLEGGDASTHIP